VPLAPYEVYRPWYGRGFRNNYNNTTINNITVVNNTNITNIYNNATVVNGRNAVTSIQVDQFGRRGTNNANFVEASASDLARAGSVEGAVPVASNASGRRFSERAVSADTVQAVQRAGARNTQFAANPSLDA